VPRAVWALLPLAAALVAAWPLRAATLDEVSALVAELQGAAAAERAGAAVRLGELGSNANTAIDALIMSALQDPDHVVRIRAIRALERISGQANVTVTALIELLDDPHPEIRWAAAGAMESFGLKAVVATPALVEMLDDPDPAARGSAASTLGKMGPVAVAALMQVLDDPNRDKKLNALKALAGHGARAGVAVPRITPFAGDPDPELRAAALLCLRRIAGDRNWPGESGWLTDPQAQIWPKAMTSAERLRGYPSLRRAIVEAALGVFGEFVGDPDPRVRYEAVKGFADLGEEGQSGAQQVAPLLRDPESRIRRAAADAVGGMGSEVVSDLVPELVSALADPDDNVRWAVIQALRNVGSDALPELIIVLEYGDPLLLPGVLATIVELGPIATEAAAYLLPHLGAGQPAIRALAAEALGSVGAVQATGALHTALDDQAEEVRLAAAWALAALGSDGPVAR